MMKRILKLTALVIVAALGLIAVQSCSQGAKVPEDEIRIGVIQPLSGDLAAYGKATLNGLQLRVDEINAEGGVNGKKLKLVIEDNKGDGNESRNAFRKVVLSDGAVAVVAPVTSGNSLKIRELAAELKVPSISPTATNDTVTQDNPYMFRTIFNDSFQGKVIANFMLNDLGIKKAAILKDMNSDYSKGLADNFSETVKANGGEIVAVENYQQKDTNFNAQLKNVKDSGAKAVFIPGYPPDVQNIIKQVKILELDVVLMGADGWDNDDIIKGSGDRISGSYIVGAFASDDARPVVAEFVKKYKAKHDPDPGMFEALGYDTISLLVEAMKTGTDKESIRSGLVAITEYPGVTGKITITDQGDAVKSAAILEIVKMGDDFGKKYKTTVNP